MKRKLVKMLTVACVTAIAASTFVGCGNKDEAPKDNEKPSTEQAEGSGEKKVLEIDIENQKEKNINDPLPNENKQKEQSKKNEDLKQDKEIQNNIKDNKDTVPEENKKNEKEKTPQIGDIVCKAGCVYGSEHKKGCDKYTGNE